MRWDAEQFDWASPDAITVARIFSRSLPLAPVGLISILLYLPIHDYDDAWKRSGMLSRSEF